MNGRSTLALGRPILDPVLTARGFAFEEKPPGRGRDDGIARAAYVRGDRRLELGVHQSLAMVVYQVAGMILSHERYMQAVLGPAGSNMYPSFTGDPLDAFRHLAHDLESYGGVFLAGPDEHFRQIVERAGDPSLIDARTTLYRR